MGEEFREPEIVVKEGFEVVGMEAAYIHTLAEEVNNAEVIGDLWGRFLEQLPALGHSPGETLYGVIRGYSAELRSHPDELRYLAGIRMEGMEVPQGLSRWVVPPATYAVFLHEGSLDRLSRTIGWIYEDWLPSADWVHAELCDVEVYDERFDPVSEDSELEYWVSVKPKQ